MKLNLNLKPKCCSPSSSRFDPVVRRHATLRRLLERIAGAAHAVSQPLALVFSLMSLCPAAIFAQTPIVLTFDSLPSAQGWTYSEPSRVPEGSVFTATGSSLLQNTIGQGLTLPSYGMFGVVDGSRPFVLTVRARVIAVEGTAACGFGFDVRTAVPNQEYDMCFTASQISDPLGNSGAVDTTVFHEYVLMATPGGNYNLYIDGQLGLTGPFSATGGPLNGLQIGDLAGLGPTNAQAEVTKFVFSQAALPRYNLCLLYDSSKAAKSGSTLPIKLEVCDAAGSDLSLPAITLHAVDITQATSSGVIQVQDSGNANPGNNFRFDSTLGSSGGYIFNLSTKGLAGGAFKLNFTVTGDSFVYSVPFQIK